MARLDPARSQLERRARERATPGRCWTDRASWLRCIPICRNPPLSVLRSLLQTGCCPSVGTRPVRTRLSIMIDALWNCGNLAAGAQAWAAALAREISNGLMGARLSSLRIQRDGRAGVHRPGRSTSPGGTWCSVRSCADGFLLFDELERCWSRSTTGSPTWSGSPERSRTWSRWTPVGKSRPASSLASHARRRLPRSSRRRSSPRCPP